ncbi:MAG: hypothetical protein AMS20_16710 [Gemmatimonas sp. SG8_28]|nr:MAG: hypothetical protein AMS20_16710 [Gemmatimonas sp. SG8_28]
MMTDRASAQKPVSSGGAGANGGLRIPLSTSASRVFAIPQCSTIRPFLTPVRELLLDGHVKIGIRRADRANVLRHDTGAGWRILAGVVIHVVRSDEVLDQAHVPGVDDLVDESADNLLVCRAMHVPSCV